MIIFRSILTTFELGSIEHWLVPKIKPLSGNLACPNLWNAYGTLLGQFYLPPSNKKGLKVFKYVYFWVDIIFFISYKLTIKAHFVFFGKKFHDLLEIFHNPLPDRDPSVEKHWFRL